MAALLPKLIKDKETLWLFAGVLLMAANAGGAVAEANKWLGWFVLAGWAIYPIAFYLPDAQKHALYSIADFFNKAVYSVILQTLL